MRFKPKGLTAILIALCLALVGCGMGGQASEQAKSNFSGVWELESLTSGTDNTTTDYHELADTLGMNVFLVLNEDGTCTLDMFGSEQEKGTWEVRSESSATYTLAYQDGDVTGELTLEDDMLKMEFGTDRLVFAKTTQEAMDEFLSSHGSLADALSGDAVDNNDFLVESMANAQTEIRSLDITPIDDEYVTLTLTGMFVDAEGDLMVVFRLVNNSDEKLIFASDDSSFQVNGYPATITCVTALDAHESVESDFFYLTGVYVEDINEVTISGTLEIDDENGRLISSYPMEV